MARAPSDEFRSAQLAEQVRRAAPRYLEGSGSAGSAGAVDELAEVRLTKAVQRHRCTLFFYDLTQSPSPSPSRTHRLVVKVPYGRVGNHDEAMQRADDRPRLFPRVGSADKSRFEHAALMRIDRDFASLADDRFRTVKIYDYLPEWHALVMAHVDAPRLRDLMQRQNRWTKGKRNLAGAFEASGAWLAAYHKLPNLEHTVERSATRDDFLTASNQFLSFVSRHARRAGALQDLRADIERAALQELPASMPLGMLHGDYAPHNIFVTEREAVVVFDTLGRFRAPIFEDLAKMLIEIKSSARRMYYRGLLDHDEDLQTFETSFLRGYFQTATIPLSAIRLFEAQLMLESWAAVIYRHREAVGMRRIAKGARRVLWGGPFWRFVRNAVPQRRSGPRP